MALGPLSEAVGPGSEGGMGWGPRKALAPLGGSAWKGEWRRRDGGGQTSGTDRLISTACVDLTASVRTQQGHCCKDGQTLGRRGGG